MVYIIAEIGNNHNGSIDKCKLLIDAAAKTGANAVKTQSFTGRDICTPKLLTSDYPNWNTKNYRYWYEFADSIALPLEAHQEIINYTNELGLDFITTPVSPKIVEFLETLDGISQYKVASMDLTNFDLIKAISSTKKPVIVSTGMSDLSEVDAAINLLFNSKLSILHCISDYPLNPKNAFLKNIEILKNKYPNYKIGFSDHSLGNELPIMAMSMGAEIIEKHFTLSRSDQDSAEHHFSMELEELRDLVDWTRIIENIKVQEGWCRSEEESEGKRQYRRSFHYNKNLQKGHILQKSDIVFLRPGNGISYNELKKVLGKPLNKTIKAYDNCSLSDFE